MELHVQATAGALLARDHTGASAQGKLLNRPRLVTVPFCAVCKFREPTGSRLPIFWHCTFDPNTSLFVALIVQALA